MMLYGWGMCRTGALGECLCVLDDDEYDAEEEEENIDDD